jgi:hypothetical protein
MGAETTAKRNVQAVSVPVEITGTGTEGHRDWGPETGARLASTAIAIAPGPNGDAECFIPVSVSAVVIEDGLIRGHAAAGLTSTAVGRGVWLLTQKPLISSLQAAVNALVMVIERCGDGDTCVLNYRQAAAVCNVHFKSFQLWMNRLAADGWITKTPKGQEGVQVRLNVQKVGCLNVCAAAQDALARAEDQLGHMRAVQDALFRDSCVRIADARKTLA